MVPVWIPLALIALWLVSAIIVMRSFDQDNAHLRSFVREIAEDNERLENLYRQARADQLDAVQSVARLTARAKMLAQKNSTLTLDIFDAEAERNDWRNKYESAIQGITETIEMEKKA